MNISPNYLYWHGKIQRVEEMHSPYFLVIVPSGMDASEARNKAIRALKEDNRIKERGY